MSYYQKKLENLYQDIDYWDKQIEELETFFDKINIHDYPIILNSCSSIYDIHKFLESHFLVLKTNKCKRSFYPFLIRLQNLRNTLKDK